MSNIIAPSNTAAPASASVSSASTKSSLGAKAGKAIVGLRRSARLLGGASSSKEPTTLQFRRTTNQVEDLYETIFPAGSLPKNIRTVARVKATLGRLVEAAEAIPGATDLTVDVHGACAQPGAHQLRVAGLDEVVSLLQKVDPPLDIPEEAPVTAPDNIKDLKPLPSPPMPAAAPLRREPENRRRAKACLRRADDELRLMARRDGPGWSDHVAKAGLEINLAITLLKSDRTPEGFILLRDAVLCRLDFIVESNESPLIPAPLFEEALKISAELLDHDAIDVYAHMARARVYWANSSNEQALAGYIDALQAHQKRNYPNDAPATLADLPMYEDAPGRLYPAIEALLPEDAPEQTRKAIEEHIERARTAQRLRNDPVVGDGTRLQGPTGGSAKSPRPQNGPLQIYTIHAPANARVGRGALTHTLLQLHQRTIADGFLSTDKESRVEQVCGFNRVTIRHDGITVEDFDGREFTIGAAGSEFYISDLCQRLVPGVAVTVVPEIQGVRSEAAECYIKCTQTWATDKAQIKWGGSVYTLPFGSDLIADVNDQRRVVAAAVNVIGHARTVASNLSYDGQRFAKLDVNEQGLSIAPQFGDARATSELRHETRAFIAHRLPIGVDQKDIVHLYKEIKRFTELPVETFTRDDVSDAMRASLEGAQAAVAGIAELLPDKTLTVTEPARPLVVPRPFNKSGYKLWQPESMFRLINEELWLRELGQLSGWGDQFEAGVMREMGLNVRIWQTKRTVNGHGQVNEAPWHRFRENVIELQEDDSVFKADDDKPAINVLRLGGVHYITLMDVENDPENWRLATAKKSVDNPGGGDCFFYSVINGAMAACPEALPQSVLDAMGSRKTAKAAAVKALRGELQLVVARLLEESPKFEEKLYAHLHPDDGFFF